MTAFKNGEDVVTFERAQNRRPAAASYQSHGSDRDRNDQQSGVNRQRPGERPRGFTWRDMSWLFALILGGWLATAAPVGTIGTLVGLFVAIYSALRLDQPRSYQEGYQSGYADGHSDALAESAEQGSGMCRSSETPDDAEPTAEIRRNAR